MTEDTSFDEWVGMMFQEAIPENNVPLVQEPRVRVECGENSVNSSEGASTDNVVRLGLATSGLDGSDGMADMDLDLAVQELDRVKCTDVLIEKPRHGYCDQPKVEAIQVGEGEQHQTQDRYGQEVEDADQAGVGQLHGPQREVRRGGRHQVPAGLVQLRISQFASRFSLTGGDRIKVLEIGGKFSAGKRLAQTMESIGSPAKRTKVRNGK
jgi:hypothetical protein